MPTVFLLITKCVMKLTEQCLTPSEPQRKGTRKCDEQGCYPTSCIYTTPPNSLFSLFTTRCFCFTWV